MRCPRHLTLATLADNNNLQGVLPNEISVLIAIEDLDLFFNNIGGTIPTVINTLSALKLFDVESNVLTGNAFVDISNLSQLESYRVSANHLVGTMPDLAANPTLREVWAAENGVVGTISSSISTLSNLGTCPSH